MNEIKYSFSNTSNFFFLTRCDTPSLFDCILFRVYMPRIIKRWCGGSLCIYFMYKCCSFLYDLSDPLFSLLRMYVREALLCFKSYSPNNAIYSGNLLFCLVCYDSLIVSLLVYYKHVYHIDTMLRFSWSTRYT